MHNNQSHHPAPTAHPAHRQAGGFSIWGEDEHQEALRKQMAG